MEVLVDDYGSYLGKKSERLIVSRNGKVEREIPFFDLERIIISSRGVSVSSDLIRECASGGWRFTSCLHAASLTPKYRLPT